ncbi:spartin-like [Haliotis asinina]|uniref:spartin-like n=1 Tax=Haliotis asinina TaxID=109174 RepID=UPI003531DCE5
MACAPAQSEQGARPRPPRPPPPNISSAERNTFSHLKRLCTKAHQHVEEALSLDEGDRNLDAKEEYLQALHLIDQAMAMDCEKLNFTADDQNAAKLMQQKLSKTKLQIEYRMQAIEREEAVTHSYPDLEERTRLDSPPSYNEAMTSGASSPVVAPGDAMMMSLGDSIMNDERQNGQVTHHANADRTFEIADGVQIFFITPQGYVSAPSYPSSLSVFKFRDEQSAGNQRPPMFMQVNDWVYPLIPGMSPSLRTTYGAYMFPDTSSDVPGAAVGLMLPDTMDAEERLKFEQLLRSLTVMEDQVVISQEGIPCDPEPAYLQVPNAETAPAYPHVPQVSHPGPVAYPQIPSAPMEQVPSAPVEQRPAEGEGQRGDARSDSTSGKISKGILVAADWISWGVGKGAEKAGQLIKYGSGKLQQQLRPEDRPRTVDPKVQKGAMYARQATHVAVKVSSFVVGKLSDATVALGKQVAPHIRKQGEKILPQVFKPSKDGQSKMDGVLEVAASGLKGFGTVYMGLETSAKALAKNLANETVGIVHHKYGDEASKFTENTLYSVGNVAMTAYNADNLGIKAITKRAAKDAGKAVLHDLQDERAKKQANGCCQNGEKHPSPSYEKPPQ